MSLPKTFSAGERLFASDLNGNFEDLDTRVDAADAQGVRAFADASARDTAIPSPSEGMVAWLDDDDELLAYDGSDWVGVGGGLVAVKSAIFTGTQTASVAAGANVAVTDLTITHEVADAANKLIISAFLGTLATSEQKGNLGIAVHDGTGLIAIGNADGSRTRVSAGAQPSANEGNNVAVMPSVTFAHTPGTGSKTYTVRAVNIRPATSTIFINRSEQDADAQFSPRGVSSLVIQEVKV